MQLEINPHGRRLKDGTPGQADFPTPTAGAGIPDGQTDQEVFYSCQECGMWCLTQRVSSPGGTSNGNGGISVNVVNSVGNPTVSRGSCPFCGTANSRKN